MRYAVDLEYQNRITDIRKNPPPLVENLAEGAKRQLAARLQTCKEAKKELDRALRAASCQSERKKERNPLHGDFSLRAAKAHRILRGYAAL